MDPYGLGIPIKFTVTNDGKIGIGTTQPVQNLHVIGDVFATGNMTASNITITGDTTVLNTRTNINETLHVNNTSVGTALSITHSGGGAASALVSVVNSGGIRAFSVMANGNVGIGTSIPVANLQVAGTIACTTIVGDASGVTGLANSAKIDTTNAGNISTGTLAANRVASVLNSTGFVGNVGIGTMFPGTSFVVRGASDFGPTRLPQVPMTANTSAIAAASTYQRLAGTYIATSSVPSATPFNAFDQSGGTFWATTNDYNPAYVSEPTRVITEDANNANIAYAGHWLQLQVPVATFLYSYSITSHSSLAETPSTWTILGSTNGSSWNNLSGITNHVWTNSSVAQTFIVNSSVAYSYYRIVVNRTAATPLVPGPARISEWRLHGDTVMYDGVRVQGGLNVGLDRGAVEGTNNVPWFHVNPSTGNVGIGTTNPLSRLHIQSGQVRITALAGGGTRAISVDNQGVIVPSLSDERLKKEIVPISYGLNEILQLNPVHFQWKDEDKFGVDREFGLIAQEVGKVMPDMVRIGEDGMLTMDYTKLVPVLIKAIQELAAVRM